jgi:RNA polymerase sigma-70 factor (ECF subfamily)
MHYDERDWVNRVIRHDSDATGEFVSKYRSRFETLARLRRVPYPDYEDVAQEALIDAQRQLPQFHWHCALGSWLGRIVSGHIANWRRKHRYATVSIFAPEQFPDGERGIETSGRGGALAVRATQELNAIVQSTLAALPAKFRMLLILNLVWGLSAKDIAERLGLPPGTVGRNITEAKEKFREILMGTENARLFPTT